MHPFNFHSCIIEFFNSQSDYFVLYFPYFYVTLILFTTIFMGEFKL